MPSTASNVGPLALPLAATPGPVDDPTLSGLAAYLAFRLNADLNGKLAVLNTGRGSDGSPVTAAVMAVNVYNRNPFKPIPLFLRGKQDGAQPTLPALYVWSDVDKGQRYSQLHGMRERQVKAAWIFAEATLPGWDVDRYGLRGAACASMFRALDEKWDPAYNPRETITVQLSLCGEGLVYQGSEQTYVAGRPSPRGAEQPVVRAYPVATVSFLAYERQDGMTALPSEAMPDLALVTSVGEDPAEALEVGEHVVPAPPYLDSV